MKEKIVGLLIVAAVLTGGIVGAQTPKPAAPKPPTLTEAETLKLDKAVLQFENTQLKIQQLQSELQRQQTDIQAMFKGFERPGFALNRDAAGAWSYVVDAKPAGAVAPTPEKPPAAPSEKPAAEKKGGD